MGWEKKRASDNHRGLSLHDGDIGLVGDGPRAVPLGLVG